MSHFLVNLLAATPKKDNNVLDDIRDFFDSGTWLVIRNLGMFLAGVFWLAMTYWVYKDARRRIEDPWLVAMATVLGVLPFIGPLIYMLFRPPEYLDDVRERELEIKAMEERLARRELHCPVCRAEVDTSFLVCPVCTTKLKQACETCKAPLEALWQVCPFCETPIPRPTAIGLESTFADEPRRRRRRLTRGRRELESGTTDIESTEALEAPQ